MLSKDQRLNLKNDFKWVASGKRVETPHFKLFFKSGENTSAKVGIALSKGQFKKAHDRNRARRLASQVLQVVYYRLLNQLNLVIIPKAGILESSVEVLQKEIEDVNSLYNTN